MGRRGLRLGGEGYYIVALTLDRPRYEIRGAVRVCYCGFAVLRVDVRIGLWDTDVVKGVMRSGRREVHSGSREVTSGLASALFVLVMWRGVDRNVKLWDIEITKGGLSPGCNVVPFGVARGHLRGAIRSFYV